MLSPWGTKSESNGALKTQFTAIDISCKEFQGSLPSSSDEKYYSIDISNQNFSSKLQKKSSSGHITKLVQGDQKPYRTLQPYQKTFFYEKPYRTLQLKFFYHDLTEPYSRAFVEFA